MVSLDVLAASVAKMASSFKEFIRASAQKLNVGEVYHEVLVTPNISEYKQLKACAWFMENEEAITHVEESSDWEQEKYGVDVYFTTDTKQVWLDVSLNVLKQCPLIT